MSQHPLFFVFISHLLFSPYYYYRRKANKLSFKNCLAVLPLFESIKFFYNRNLIYVYFHEEALNVNIVKVNCVPFLIQMIACAYPHQYPYELVCLSKCNLTFLDVLKSVKNRSVKENSYQLKKTHFLLKKNWVSQVKIDAGYLEHN